MFMLGMCVFVCVYFCPFTVMFFLSKIMSGAYITVVYMLLPSPLNSVSEYIILLLQRPNSNPYPNMKGNDMLSMTTPHDGYEWVYIDIGYRPYS